MIKILRFGFLKHEFFSKISQNFSRNLTKNKSNFLEKTKKTINNNKELSNTIPKRIESYESKSLEIKEEKYQNLSKSDPKLRKVQIYNNFFIVNDIYYSKSLRNYFLRSMIKNWRK